MELWKDIDGYEGFYQVSNTGLIRSLERHVPHPRYGKTQYVAGRILKPGTDGWGYQFVYLCKDAKPRMKKVHRLVAFAFVPNESPELYYDINHEDGNKKNNHYLNLTWVNDSINNLHAFKTGLKKRLFGKNNSLSKPVIQLSKSGEKIKQFDSIMDAERELGICNANISYCASGKPHCKTAGGFKWRYAV